MTITCLMRNSSLIDFPRRSLPRCGIRLTSAVRTWLPACGRPVQAQGYSGSCSVAAAGQTVARCRPARCGRGSRRTDQPNALDRRAASMTFECRHTRNRGRACRIVARCVLISRTHSTLHENAGEHETQEKICLHSSRLTPTTFLCRAIRGLLALTRNDPMKSSVWFSMTLLRAWS
jgi:hypothetical protein